MKEDTIAAISTSLGEAGIGIVRVSGPEAIKIVNNVVRLKSGHPVGEAVNFSLSLGTLIDASTGEDIDEVLVGVMRAPKTYTREDVVEINCHGGLVPVRRCLEVLLQNGARLAEPGEFTRRAFLNGRIDLAQAEAVVGVIRARSETGARAALWQLRGLLSGEIRKIRRQLTELIAFLEADVDFPEDDFERLSKEEIENRIDLCRKEVRKLVAGAEKGRLLREGVSTVIVGKPNVGKSSILNALLGEERAIVTEVAGTTRDAVSEIISIGGVLLRIVDTAGIRETSDIIERLGVEKATELIQDADLVLFVLDVSTAISEEDRKVRDLIQGKKGIMVANKADLDHHRIGVTEVEEFASGWPVLWVSALTAEGIGALEEELGRLVLAETELQESVVIINIRHKLALEESLKRLEDASGSVVAGMPVDCSLVDIRAAWEELGEIIGENISEEILDNIFAQFCIGK